MKTSINQKRTSTVNRRGYTSDQWLQILIMSDGQSTVKGTEERFRFKKEGEGLSSCPDPAVSQSSCRAWRHIYSVLPLSGLGRDRSGHNTLPECKVFESGDEWITLLQGTTGSKQEDRQQRGMDSVEEGHCRLSYTSLNRFGKKKNKNLYTLILTSASFFYCFPSCFFSFVA